MCRQAAGAWTQKLQRRVRVSKGGKKGEPGQTEKGGKRITRGGIVEKTAGKKNECASDTFFEKRRGGLRCQGKKAPPMAHWVRGGESLRTYCHFPQKRRKLMRIEKKKGERRENLQSRGLGKR